jgi:cytosine/adenosine deaminase-related metal-dependent hydrolase
VFAATATDVTQVMVDGRLVVRQGDREELGRELDEAIGRVWR